MTPFRGIQPPSPQGQRYPATNPTPIPRPFEFSLCKSGLGRYRATPAGRLVLSAARGHEPVGLALQHGAPASSPYTAALAL